MAVQCVLYKQKNCPSWRIKGKRTKQKQIVPLRRGTAKRYRSFALLLASLGCARLQQQVNLLCTRLHKSCDDGTFMFPKECRSETKAINKVAEGVDRTTARDFPLCYFYFFLSTFCFLLSAFPLFSTPSSSTSSLPLPLRRGRIFEQVSAEDKFTCTMPNAAENQRS